MIEYVRLPGRGAELCCPLASDKAQLRDNWFCTRQFTQPQMQLRKMTQQECKKANLSLALSPHRANAWGDGSYKTT
eukprot:2762569-Amphidinium_carterae.1